MTGRDATGAWENEGGARPASRTPARPTPGEESAERRRQDRAHDSNARGEHRYPDASQTPSEQEHRRQRDDLKQRLGGTGGGSSR